MAKFLVISGIIILAGVIIFVIIFFGVREGCQKPKPAPKTAPAPVVVQPPAQTKGGPVLDRVSPAVLRVGETATISLFGSEFFQGDKVRIYGPKGPKDLTLAIVDDPIDPWDLSLGFKRIDSQISGDLEVGKYHIQVVGPANVFSNCLFNGLEIRGVQPEIWKIFPSKIGEEYNPKLTSLVIEGTNFDPLCKIFIGSSKVTEHLVKVTSTSQILISQLRVQGVKLWPQKWVVKVINPDGRSAEGILTVGSVGGFPWWTLWIIIPAVIVAGIIIFLVICWLLGRRRNGGGDKEEEPVITVEV